TKAGRRGRERAPLPTPSRRETSLREPVPARLLDALLKSKADRQQQIHYFYCLRLLHDGWTATQKAQLLAWYDATKSWSGGHSFTPFLENILKDLNPAFNAADRLALLEKAEKLPLAPAALLRSAPNSQLPAPAALDAAYQRVSKAGAVPLLKELKQALVAALGRQTAAEAQAVLRRIADADPGQREDVARALARSPT